jgi:hypothetical protein
VKNLTVEGEGRVLLRFLDPVAIAFRVLGGENVALKNVSIDYVESPSRKAPSSPSTTGLASCP